MTESPQIRASISGLPEWAFDQRWHLATLVFLLASTLYRMTQLGAIQLAPDEAYYWDWSRRLALGYYDQGPFIAYLIRVTTAIFGTNEFGVRFGVLASCFGTLCCTYVLAKRLFAPMTGFLAVLLLGLSPLMEVGSIVATYDPPLVFFWALAVVWLERALFADKTPERNRAWVFAGLATGLGFLSKHTMLFLCPCLVLFLLISPTHRHWLKRPQPYLAFMLALLLYSGVFYWNSQHHWWTFGHLLFLTKKVSGTPIKRLGDLLGSQLALLGPGLFLATMIAGFKGMMLGQETAGAQRSRFLACMGLPVMALFCLLSLKSKVQANWPACAWMSLTILWTGWVTVLAGRSRASARTAAILVSIVALLSLIPTVVIISPEARMALGIRLQPDQDTSNTTFGWRELAARVEVLREKQKAEGRPYFIAGNGYQNVALLGFYLKDHPETYDLFMHNRLDMYAVYVERLKSHLGEDAIFVDDNDARDADLRLLFEEVVPEPDLVVWRRPLYNVPIKTLHIVRCRKFRKYVGLEWAEGG